MIACADCGRTCEPSGRDGLCFRCKLSTLSFTYRGAHPGRAGWNEATVQATKKEIYEGARQQGIDITRA